LSNRDWSSDVCSSDLFDIEAELWAQPLPLRLFLRTEIDLETGGVKVSEADGQRG
jgi:type VI secretion system protein ImpF